MQPRQPAVDSGGEPVQDAQPESASLDIFDFWSFWRENKASLYSICLCRMKGRREDAEDALGCVMLKLVETLPARAGQIDDLVAWASRVTRNACIDIRRHGKVDTWGERTVFPFRQEALDASQRHDSPEDRLLGLERHARLRLEISELPELLREACVLRFVCGTPYDEIASKLSISPANARKRIEQARRILRTHKL